VKKRRQQRQHQLVRPFRSGGWPATTIPTFATRCLRTTLSQVILVHMMAAPVPSHPPESATRRRSKSETPRLQRHRQPRGDDLRRHRHRCPPTPSRGSRGRRPGRPPRRRLGHVPALPAAHAAARSSWLGGGAERPPQQELLASDRVDVRAWSQFC